MCRVIETQRCNVYFFIFKVFCRLIVQFPFIQLSDLLINMRLLVQGHDCLLQYAARSFSSFWTSYKFLVRKIPHYNIQFFLVFWHCSNGIFREIFGRKNWIIGMLLSMVVPLWKYKLGPLLQLKSKDPQSSSHFSSDFFFLEDPR